MNQATIVRRVCALTARASHPGTPPLEADAARAKADELTRRYGLHDLDLVSSAELAGEPTIVHWMSGFSPTGSRWRAWCRCGFGTTPRVDRGRALRALTDAHPLVAAECVLCAVTYVEWMDFRRFLQVFKDPMSGNEYAMCIDPTACRART